MLDLRCGSQVCVGGEMREVEGRASAPHFIKQGAWTPQFCSHVCTLSLSASLRNLWEHYFLAFVLCKGWPIPHPNCHHHVPCHLSHDQYMYTIIITIHNSYDRIVKLKTKFTKIIFTNINAFTIKQFDYITVSVNYKSRSYCHCKRQHKRGYKV